MRVQWVELRVPLIIHIPRTDFKDFHPNPDKSSWAANLSKISTLC
jgi:hypothetical protein